MNAAVLTQGAALLWWQLALSVVVVSAGDVLCKMAGTAHVDDALYFTVGGAIAYAICAPIWVWIYSTRNIVEVMVISTPLHNIGTALVSKFVFGEKLPPNLIWAFVLMLVIIWLMES